ncbi:MAG: hypothetical protein ACOYNL_04000 [Rickettsiales bacterium]
MSPRFSIRKPVTAMGRGCAADTRLMAADRAAASLLHTDIIDWMGLPTSLLICAQRVGLTEELRWAAKEVFLMLTTEGVTYRQYHLAEKHSPASVNQNMRLAMESFYHVIENIQEAQILGLGRGELLLIAFDHHIVRYLKEHTPLAPNPLSSTYKIVG